MNPPELRIIAAACPALEIFFKGFPSGTTTVTIWRIAGGVEYPVRGAVDAAVAGSLTRVDFEVPFNRPVQYRAECFDRSGRRIAFTPTASITVPVRDTWMHNPLDPAGAARVVALDTAAGQISRPVPGEISRPIGRRVGVALTQPRQGLTGFTFDVWTGTIEDADRVQAMFGTSTRDVPPVVCVRLGAGSRMRIPQPFYLAVLDAVEEDWTGRYGGEDYLHRLTGDEAAPPVPGLHIPLLTRNDIDRAYATRDGIDADNGTRDDIDRRYDLASFAEEGA